MYVCSQNTAKTVHHNAKTFTATLLTICLSSFAVSSFVQVGKRKKIIKLSQSKKLGVRSIFKSKQVFPHPLEPTMRHLYEFGRFLWSLRASQNERLLLNSHNFLNINARALKFSEIILL